MSDDDEVEYGMVMPFVICASQGGPHEDGAFVAGYECGHLDALLQHVHPPHHDSMFRTDSMPQIDLIAMRHGYTLTAEPWDEHPDQWTRVIFDQGSPLGGEGSST